MYHGDNHGRFTYSEMRERVEAIACGLMSLGFKKADKAAIMAPSSPYWTHVDMALANAGGVSVTIYPTLSLNEVRYIMKDSGSKYLFAGNEDILNGLKPGLRQMPALKKIIVMDLAYKGSDKKIIGLTELMETGREWKKKHYPVYRRQWPAYTDPEGQETRYPYRLRERNRKNVRREITYLRARI